MPFDNATYTGTTLADLIAWLEKQPADRAYQGNCIRRCVLCQWLSASAGKQIEYAVGHGGNPGHYGDFGRDEYDMSALEFTVARAEPHTFGAALIRARALQAQQS